MNVPVPPRRLELVNVPPRRWWLLPFKVLGFLLATGLTAALAGAAVLYAVFAPTIPDIPQVARYWPPVLSQVMTQDAVLAGELYRERRKVVPYERIPKRLVQAFIASEDSDYFDHLGVDVLGTARAAYKTLLKKATGRGSVQGGSTLTQQTAKAVLISSDGYEKATEKSLTRKIREALLARRLEAELTKEEILYLYLNNVYLGHHSYGVQSAAENYFRKDVKDLDLGEISLLAGLPQAPSKYSPFLNPQAARKRRSYVLRRMLDEGMVSRAEHDAAEASPIAVHPVEDVFREFAPYFTEEVRRDVVGRYGNRTVLEEGLTIFTTMDSEKQRAAQQSVLYGLLALDKRQGFRGPVAHLEGAALQDFLDRAARALGDEPITPGRYYVGAVTAIDKAGELATVSVGKVEATLPLLGMRWARKVEAERYYLSTFIDSIRQALQVGDVVVVRAVAQPRELVDDSESWREDLARRLPTDVPLVRLEQEPEPQSALVSIDPHRQYLVAMVGGYDFDANEFNRAFQACRQPGSSFKPIVYAGALELGGYTQGTVLVDSPIVYDDPENQNRWKPANYDENFKGEVLLKDALVNSMNVPAVKTFIDLARKLGNRNEVVGIAAIGDFARKLGFSTRLNPDYSAALGSSCVYPYELAQVYATIDRLGVKKPTYFLRKVEDRFGRTLEDHTAFDDAWATLPDRLAAGYARLAEPGEQVLSRETAYLVTDMMRGVVTSGTGAPASRLQKPAAGKTGTTNDSFDAWFTAFTRDLVTTAWVGYDLNPHPLGKYETGGRAALPIWLSYMRKALEGREQPEFSPPPGLDLVSRRVDRRTGRLASAGSRNTVVLYFRRGTEPEDAEPERGQVAADDFLQTP